MNLFTQLSAVLFLSVMLPLQGQEFQDAYEIPEENYDLKTLFYGHLNVPAITQKIDVGQLSNSLLVQGMQKHELDRFFGKMLPGIEVKINALHELGISTKDNISFSYQNYDMGSLRMSYQMTVANKTLLLQKIAEMAVYEEGYKMYMKTPGAESHTFIIGDYYTNIKITNLTLHEDQLLFSVVVIEKMNEEEDYYPEAVPYEYDYQEETYEETYEDEAYEGVYEEETYEEEPEEAYEITEGIEEPYEDEADDEYDEEDYIALIDTFDPIFKQIVTSDNGRQLLPESIKEELEGKNLHDVTFWMDYANFMEIFNNNIYGELRYMPYDLREFFLGWMTSNYEGTSYLWGINFEQGQIASTLKSYFNERWEGTMKKYMKSSFSGSMLKYLSKDYLFCAGYSVKPQPITEIIKEHYYPMLDTMLPSYAATVQGVVELVDLVIDEKAIYKFIEGDIIFSFNGMQEVQVASRQRVYDENYEYTYETEVIKKKIPNITIMLSTKDDERWEKVIRMGAIAKDYFEARKGYYVLTLGNDGYFYFAVKNGVVIATTNEAIVTQYLDSGFPSAMALNSEDKKAFKKNNIVMLGQPLTIAPKDRDLREFKEFTDKLGFQHMYLKGGKVKGNSMLFTSEITFDTDKNSIDHIIQMLDIMMQ